MDNDNDWRNRENGRAPHLEILGPETPIDELGPQRRERMILSAAAGRRGAHPVHAAKLDEMAATARAKNAEYGANYTMMGPVMQALFPNGVPSAVVLSTKWHLFELAVVKITRLAATNLTHVDSAHDLGIYGAMLETEIEREASE